MKQSWSRSFSGPLPMSNASELFVVARLPPTDHPGFTEFSGKPHNMAVRDWPFPNSQCLSLHFHCLSVANTVADRWRWSRPRRCVAPRSTCSPPQVAVDQTLILLHPPLPLVGASTVMERKCQQNDSLANGEPQGWSRSAKRSSTRWRKPT